MQKIAKIISSLREKLEFGIYSTSVKQCTGKKYLMVNLFINCHY